MTGRTGGVTEQAAVAAEQEQIGDGRLAVLVPGSRYAELTALLNAAGFGSVRRAPTHTPLLVSVLVAKAPEVAGSM